MIREAAKSIVFQGGPNVVTEANVENKDLKRSMVDTDFGYLLIVIINKMFKSYTEQAIYTVFDGLTMIKPESGKSYDVFVKSRETKVILFKKDARQSYRIDGYTDCQI